NERAPRERCNENRDGRDDGGNNNRRYAQKTDARSEGMVPDDFERSETTPQRQQRLDRLRRSSGQNQ
ncbi:hypothetical protein LW976_17750, partial [Erwinia amylovora]|uniref:hypothetical protein n=1 Tax=Erwinia amylovora TaxID=552 RepID=UPI0020C06881